MKTKTNLIEVYIVKIVNNKVRYLLLKRSATQKYPNIWQMVTGKIKKNEKAYSAAIREIAEETNLEVSKLYVVPKVSHFYNNEDDSINFVPVFIAFVNNKYTVKISEEHCEYKWVKKREAKQLLAWPGQIELLNIIHDYLNNQNGNINFVEIYFRD